MQHKEYGIVVAMLLDALLVVDLVSGRQVVESAALWIFLHIVIVSLGSVLLYRVLLEADHSVEVERSTYDKKIDDHDVNNADELRINYFLLMFVVLVGLSIPGVGLAGISLTLVYALHASNSRTYTPENWQITSVAALPYVAPVDRQLKPVDSRGFTEHVLYSKNDDDVYHKVLSSAQVRTSLAINTLKQAMRHDDERVRLTAYNTLDRKVTTLNKQIQRLEKQLNTNKDSGSSDRWLQIASNYWELVTLEGAEVVARKQLLAKASSAAIKAVAQLPGNRNAHLVLGRVSLAQGDTRRATVALERAQALGMPADKVLPYLAECAFMDKNFPRVQRLLAGLDSSIVAYPPLSHVARYWA